MDMVSEILVFKRKTNTVTLKHYAKQRSTENTSHAKAKENDFVTFV